MGCQQCDFYNKNIIGCKHLYWFNCIKRDYEGYITKYIYYKEKQEERDE